MNKAIIESSDIISRDEFDLSHNREYDLRRNKERKNAERSKKGAKGNFFMRLFPLRRSLNLCVIALKTHHF